MQVNICSRLIEKFNKRGTTYVYMLNDYSRKIVMNQYEVIPLGLYATKCYKINDIVRIMTGNLLNISTQKSIHIGDNMHLEDKYGQYVNHSFHPNVKVVSNKLIAIQDINMYDEITFNYNESELEMACPFEDDGVLVCGIKK